ncbi:MAG TPA: Wzz/FepE/Etk N-terminal domain-containing protein [Clostridia bacterium]
MSIGKLFEGVLRRMWLVLVLAVAGCILAAAASKFMMTDVYHAETTIYAINHKTQASGSPLSMNLDDIMVSQQILKNYGDVITSYYVISEALKELNNPNVSEGMLRSMVSISLKKDSSLMVVGVEAPNAKLASDAANAVAKAFSKKIKDITNVENIGILDEAREPKHPEPKGTTKTVVLGILAGMLIAFAIIYLAELFDKKVRCAEDIELSLGVPVIAVIPEHDIN